MKFEKPWYIVLGVNLNSSDEEIRKAYLELVKKYHPDKYPKSSEEERKVIGEKLKEINIAYKNSKEKQINSGTNSNNSVPKYDVEESVGEIIKSYNFKISDSKISYILNCIVTLTILSYDEENLGKEWNRFSSFRTPDYLDKFGCNIIEASNIIENNIPIEWRNTAYGQYIINILYILFMSKEDTLITLPRAL